MTSILQLTLLCFFQGGDNPDRQSSYHPLYITDHPEGAFGPKSHAERKLEVIYAGVDTMGGNESPTGYGPLCEYVSTDGADKAAQSKTFEVSLEVFQVVNRIIELVTIIAPVFVF